MEQESELISHTEAVTRLAHSLGHDSVVIGTAALAGYHYVRLTNDLDLGGILSLDQLRGLAKALKCQLGRQEFLRVSLEFPLHVLPASW